MALYKEASRILRLVDEQRGSIKNLTFSSRYKNKRQLYALVCETAKHSSVLQKILNATQIQDQEKLIKETSLAKALLYDFLFGKGLSGTDPLEQAVLHHSSKLKSEAKKLKTKTQDSEIEELSEVSVVLPRYVRVNTLKTTVADVISHFVEEGFELIATLGLNCSRYLDVLRNLKNKEFAVDIDIPQLLVFSSGTDLHEHKLYKSGNIILQDKASCLPAVVLNPPAGSHVIDCCAAPGNKTTFLAAMMGDIGTICAFDKDKKRLKTMKALTQRTGASCLSLHNADFLRVNPRDPQYSNVEYILVDPSCSGSGNVLRRVESIIGSKVELKTGRAEHAEGVGCSFRIVGRTLAPGSEPGASAARLKSLASFQAMILKHALSFPKAKRVVYSTCSVHKEENEHVVLEVLTAYKHLFALTYILPSLVCRGNPEIFADAVKCVSMNPEGSLTNGFFISCFERISLNSECLSGIEMLNAKVSKKKKRKNSERNVETLKESLVRTCESKESDGVCHKKQKVDPGFYNGSTSRQKVNEPLTAFEMRSLTEATKREKKRKMKKNLVKLEIVSQQPNNGQQNDKHRKLKKRKRRIKHHPITSVGRTVS